MKTLLLIIALYFSPENGTHYIAVPKGTTHVKVEFEVKESKWDKWPRPQQRMWQKLKKQGKAPQGPVVF